MARCRDRPASSGFVAHPEAGLLFIPVAGGPIAPVLDWMSGIGGVGREGACHRHDPEGPAQVDAHAARVSSVSASLRHPMLRCDPSLSRPAATRGCAKRRDPGCSVASRYKCRSGPSDRTTDLLAFAGFLKGHLKGQTSLRIPPNWATQAALLQAAAQVALPQRIDPGTEADGELARLAEGLGVDAPDSGPREELIPIGTDICGCRSAEGRFRRLSQGFRAVRFRPARRRT
jgi:hypothetical protein